VTEYDPDFDPRGIQAYTSLGESGPAPVVFNTTRRRTTCRRCRSLFQNPEVYNRKGRTFNFDDLDQLVHGDFPGGLKDVNTSRCDVKQPMVDVYARWVELTDFDGFRIDTVKHVEHEFWRYFAQNVRQRLAEEGKTELLHVRRGVRRQRRADRQLHQADDARPPERRRARRRSRARERAGGGRRLPGGGPSRATRSTAVFYFSQYFQAMRDVFRTAEHQTRIQTLWDGGRRTSGTSAERRTGRGLAPSKTLVNFLDNHDVPRFLYNGSGRVAVQGPTRRQALSNALLFLLTEDGIPCIYYGTEQELAGGNDPANREDLWNTGIRRTADVPVDQAAHGIRKRTRRSVAATRRWSGRPSTPGDEEDAGIFAFERGAATRATNTR
jgi:alpha-amylase